MRVDKREFVWGFSKLSCAGKTRTRVGFFSQVAQAQQQANAQTPQAQTGQQQVQVATQEAQQQQAANSPAVTQNTAATQQHTEYTPFVGQVRHKN